MEREEGEIVFVYDESVFMTTDPITEEEIEADFATYWARGYEPDGDETEGDEPMTREELTAKVNEHSEELTLIEDAIIEMSEKVYK